VKLLRLETIFVISVVTKVQVSVKRLGRWLCVLRKAVQAIKNLYPDSTTAILFRFDSSKGEKDDSKVLMVQHGLENVCFCLLTKREAPA
jgi:hypothetical protein